VGKQAQGFPGMFWNRQEGHIDEPKQKPPLDTPTDAPTVARSSRRPRTMF
jgi:hypothetical protein